MLINQITDHFNFNHSPSQFYACEQETDSARWRVTENNNDNNTGLNSIAAIIIIYIFQLNETISLSLFNEIVSYKKKAEEYDMKNNNNEHPHN